MVHLLQRAFDGFDPDRGCDRHLPGPVHPFAGLCRRVHIVVAFLILFVLIVQHARGVCAGLAFGLGAWRSHSILGWTIE